MVLGRSMSTGMSATTRPGRGESTTTRSATRMASGMLWVTMHDGRGGAVPEPQQLEVEALAGQRIERAERLVEEQDLGLECERSREGDALAGAAGELRGPRLDDRRIEPDEVGQARQALATARRRPSRRARAGR